MEDGQARIRVFIDPNPGLDVVMAVAILRDLQAEVLVSDRVVVADGALYLDAEDDYQQQVACD
jgi:hypothetical protein